MKTDQKLDVQRLVQLQKEITEIYNNSGMIAIRDNGVHIQERCMEEVAPLDQWELNLPRLVPGEFPYEHRIVVDGVTFFCITTEKIEKAKVNG